MTCWRTATSTEQCRRRRDCDSATRRRESLPNGLRKDTGSVAAPTAGLHFTPELLDAIRAKGVTIEEVTLHVGIGTFRPVQSATLEEHVMHSEWVHIDDAVAERINAAKADHRRIIAVGTTTVRVLEGVTRTCGELRGYSGEINIFITPGFDFKNHRRPHYQLPSPKVDPARPRLRFADRDNALAAYDVAKRL